MKYHADALCRYEWADDEERGWKGYTVVYAPRRYSRCPACGSPVIQHMRTSDGDWVKCGNPDCGEVQHVRGDMMDSLDADIMHTWMCAVDHYINRYRTRMTSDCAHEECPCCGGRLFWEIRNGCNHEVSACMDCGWTDGVVYIDKPVFNNTEFG